MPDQTWLRRTLTWSLASFHAAFLFAALIALLYAGGGLGGLLASLNTLLGLGLYALFLLNTWWTTGRATRGLDWVALADPWAPLDHFWRIVLWGGVNGLLLFLVLLAAIVGSSLLLLVSGRGQPVQLLPFVLTVGAVGSAVAFVAGALAGVFFALLDSALLVLAGWWLSRATAPD